MLFFWQFDGFIVHSKVEQKTKVFVFLNKEFEMYVYFPRDSSKEMYVYTSFLEILASLKPGEGEFRKNMCLLGLSSFDLSVAWIGKL